MRKTHSRLWGAVSAPAILAILLAAKAVAADSATVTLDPDVRYQTIIGWSGMPWYPLMSAEVRDQIVAEAVDDLGLTWLHWTVPSGNRVGQGSWEPTNDDGDPLHINWPAFGTEPVDRSAREWVLPFKRWVEARGERFFWYVAAAPVPPYPNVQLEHPLIASRSFIWMSWKYRVSGFEYYCYNLWGNNFREGKRWPEVPWNVRGFKQYNSDGILFYPGPEGTPCSSVRLENLRDGVEDWESFYILRDYADVLRAKKPVGQAAELLAASERLLDVPDEVVTSVTIWTQDPQLLLKARRQLGETIVAMKRFVTQAEYEKFRDARQAERLARTRQMLKDRVAGKLPETRPAR